MIISTEIKQIDNSEFIEFKYNNGVYSAVINLKKLKEKKIREELRKYYRETNAT